MLLPFASVHFEAASDRGTPKSHNTVRRFRSVSVDRRVLGEQDLDLILLTIALDYNVD